MLKFSNEEIKFDYSTNNHLVTKLIIKNTELFPIYYKFKVNRPRFYLVKPDRGLISPNSTIEINIKLHKQGISQANSDKFKCFYIRASSDSTDHNMDKFQQKAGALQQRFLVSINNLPLGLENARDIPVASSQVKSLQNTKLNSINSNSNRNSTTFQSIIKSRQDRVSSLKSQIQSMQKSLRDRKIAQGPIKQTSSSLIPLIVTGVVAVALGMVTSVWI